MPLARFPSPTQTRVFPGLAIYDWSKSETSDLDAGEGDGVCRSDNLNFTKPARASGARPGLRPGGGRRRDRTRLLGRGGLGGGGVGGLGVFWGGPRRGRGGARAGGGGRQGAARGCWSGRRPPLPT